MRRLTAVLFGPIAALLLFASAAHADTFTVNITVDEFCNGTLTNSAGFSGALPCDFRNDPGPGGLANVMTYSLLNPPGLTSGDVKMQEGTSILDVIRFNADESCAGGSVGCLVFYSDNLDGFDAPADTASPPTAFYTNVVTILEVNGVGVYTPTAGQPGFVTGAAGPVTYTFISDATVPEPGTLLLLGSGVVGLAARIRRRARA